MSRRKRRLTIKEAQTLMARAVEEKGANHVVTQCQYFTYAADETPQQPCCIVGQVLSYAGVTGEELASWEGTGADYVVKHFFPQTSESVLEALRAAQTLQDAQQPWGEAYSEFERVLPKAA